MHDGDGRRDSGWVGDKSKVRWGNVDDGRKGLIFEMEDVVTTGGGDRSSVASTGADTFNLSVWEVGGDVVSIIPEDFFTCVTGHLP